MSDNNITDAAEARRRRFIEAKNESGGSAEDLIKKQEGRLWTLYFDENGIIQCFTQEEGIEVKPGWKTHNFSQDQLSILHKKDLRKYHVVADPKIDNVYSIELKPLQSVKLPSVNDFLSEVEYNNIDDYEVKCKIADDVLIVSLHDSVKDEYKDVYPVSATRNGYRILRFYITKPQDPHVMYEYKHVSLADLLTTKETKLQLGMNLEHCSIYTNKIFDKYQRA